MEERELIIKQIRMNKFKIIMDAILIVVLIAIGIYVFLNIESFKTFGSDVCRLCMEKTGSQCFQLP